MLGGDRIRRSDGGQRHGLPVLAGKRQPPVGSLAVLGGCPSYPGANPIYLYPPGQPYQLTSTSWSLSTVLTCGLQIPLGAVTGVQVLNPGHGFEPML